MVLGLVLFLVGVAVLGLVDATSGGDWPGWDEGWALVAFPLGVPLALYLGAGVANAEIDPGELRPSARLQSGSGAQRSS